MLLRSAKSSTPISNLLKLSSNGKQLVVLATDKAAQTLASTQLSIKLGQALEDAKHLEQNIEA